VGIRRKGETPGGRVGWAEGVHSMVVTSTIALLDRVELVIGAGALVAVVLAAIVIGSTSEAGEMTVLSVDIAALGIEEEAKGWGGVVAGSNSDMEVLLLEAVVRATDREEGEIMLRIDAEDDETEVKWAVLTVDAEVFEREVGSTWRAAEVDTEAIVLSIEEGINGAGVEVKVLGSIIEILEMKASSVEVSTYGEMSALSAKFDVEGIAEGTVLNAEMEVIVTSVTTIVCIADIEELETKAGSVELGTETGLIVLSIDGEVSKMKAESEFLSVGSWVLEIEEKWRELSIDDEVLDMEVDLVDPEADTGVLVSSVDFELEETTTKARVLEVGSGTIVVASLVEPVTTCVLAGRMTLSVGFRFSPLFGGPE
jgi:hypothetical protein